MKLHIYLCVCVYLCVWLEKLNSWGVLTIQTWNESNTRGDVSTCKGSLTSFICMCICEWSAQENNNKAGMQIKTSDRVVRTINQEAIQINYEYECDMSGRFKCAVVCHGVWVTYDLKLLNITADSIKVVL